MRYEIYLLKSFISEEYLSFQKVYAPFSWNQAGSANEKGWEGDETKKTCAFCRYIFMLILFIKEYLDSSYNNAFMA